MVALTDRRHWPIGLIYDNHTISKSLNASSSQADVAVPLRIILHLASPPADKLLMQPNQEACKQAFMGQMKEADFIRWGNTKRMTSLRKQEQDGMWEGVREHNFDDYWRVASKVIPTTSPVRPQSPIPNSSVSMHTRPPSADGALPSDKDGAYSVRSVPVRIYLPDGPVLQDLVPPLLDDGTPHTLSRYLSHLTPLLFPPKSSDHPTRPPPPPAFPSGRSSVPNAQDARSGFAYALIQGVLAPGDSEMAWLGACLTGADGWLNVCVGLRTDQR
jgi:autophagy-related protein 5